MCSQEGEIIVINAQVCALHYFSTTQFKNFMP